MFWVFFSFFFFLFFQNTGSQLYLSVFFFFTPVSVHSLHDTQFGSVITLIYHAIKIRNAVDMKKQFCSHTVCVLENAFSVSVYTVFYLFIPVAQGNSVCLLTRRTIHWVHQLETKTKGGGGVTSQNSNWKPFDSLMTSGSTIWAMFLWHGFTLSLPDEKETEDS